jgi:hypothetical protein
MRVKLQEREADLPLMLRSRMLELHLHCPYVFME